MVSVPKLIRDRLPSKSAVRELLLAWVHLAVLWAFAFSKPLFDVLADSPEFFVARGNTRADIVLFAVGLVLIPPTLLALVEAIFARVPPVRRLLHLFFVAALVSAFALQLLEDAIGGSTELLLVLGAAAGLAVAVGYLVTRAIPAVLTVLGPVPLAFLLLFLFLSPVSKLVLPEDDAEAANADVDSRTPVVMLVFDEFDVNMLMDRDQRIDPTRYPNFAALADEATWYRNATTVADGTLMAVPAILSGRRPEVDSLPVQADYPDTLFTLLGDSYEHEVIETATELCPERLCGERTREEFGDRMHSLVSDLGVVSLRLAAPEGVDSRLPAVDRTFSDFVGGGRDAVAAGPASGERDVPSSFFKNRTKTFEALLAGVRAGRARPSFHFLHTAFPHVPWQYLPTGHQYLLNGPESPGLEDETWTSDPWLPRQGQQRHMLQVGYVDRLLGRLTDRLKRAGIYDRALIVLTADHGASYRPGAQRRQITRETATDIAGVPLLIKYPGRRRGRVDDSPARTIDVLPTIADQLGVELPDGVDGRSLLQEPRPPGGEVKVAATLSDGRFVSLPFDTFKRERTAALQRLVGVFGSNDGGRGLYATGPGSDLLGSDAADLVSSAPPAARVELDAAELYENVRPSAQLIPSLVSGRIVGEIPAGRALAVALNGRVRAVTTSFSWENGLRFAAMVPPQDFRAGSNTIEVFTIDGSRTARRLGRLEMEEVEPYRLVERDGEQVIVGGAREATVDAGRLEGYVEELARDDEGLRVFGWAADTQTGGPASRILVFAGSRLVTQGTPTVERRDVAQAVEGLEAVELGFQLKSSAAGVELDELRVFAVAGDAASELDRP